MFLDIIKHIGPNTGDEDQNYKSDSVYLLITSRVINSWKYEQDIAWSIGLEKWNNIYW